MRLHIKTLHCHSLSSGALILGGWKQKESFLLKAPYVLPLSAVFTFDRYKSAGICIAIGLKCVVCFNTAAECLKVRKLVSDSPDHVTLCPCGPVEPRVDRFFLGTSGSAV